MSLSDTQIKEILINHGYLNIGEMGRDECIQRDRSTLSKIVIVDHNHHPVLHLIEKTMLADKRPFENQMYALFAKGRTASHIPKVFYNHFDEAQQRGILLLEDLSQAYQNISDWIPPIHMEQLLPVLDSVSAFHRLGWSMCNEKLMPGHLKDEQSYLTHLGYLERDYLYFKQENPFHFQDDDFKIYEESLDRLHQKVSLHIERMMSYTNTTIIHGDLNVGNLMYPRSGIENVKIIDLEAIRIGLCTEDLVMLFIHDLFHGQEITLEILKTYYGYLTRDDKGIVYSYDEFMEDFKFSLSEGIFFPLKLFTLHGIRDVEFLHRSLSAYKAFIDKPLVADN